MLPLTTPNLFRNGISARIVCSFLEAIGSRASVPFVCRCIKTVVSAAHSLVQYHRFDDSFPFSSAGTVGDVTIQWPQKAAHMRADTHTCTHMHAQAHARTYTLARAYAQSERNCSYIRTPNIHVHVGTPTHWGYMRLFWPVSLVTLIFYFFLHIVCVCANTHTHTHFCIDTMYIYICVCYRRKRKLTVLSISFHLLSVPFWH